MKKKIETEVTITIKIEDKEFYLTSAEAEDLYTALQDALGKNILKLKSPSTEYQKYEQHQYHPPVVLTHPCNPRADQIWCKSNNKTQ